VDPLTGRILPAKSLEEILDLNATLSNETRVFEALEEEKFPYAGNILIQSLENTTQNVLEQLDLKKCSLKAQVSLLSLLGTSFKAQTLKAFNAQKLKGFDQGTLDFLLYHAKDKASLELLFGLKANPKTQNDQGETPLYARIKALKSEDQESTWPLLKALVEGGINLNRGTKTGSVLDLVLEKRLDLIFTNLLELNTSRWEPRHPLKVDSELLLRRYRQWIKEGRKDKTLERAFKLLNQMSPQSAWYMALEDVLPPPQPVELSYEGLLKIAKEQLRDEDDREFIEGMIQKKRSLESIKEKLEKLLKRPLTSLQDSGEKIQGVFMGERCLLPEVKQQLFDETGKVRRSNTYGRRDVARVEHQGKVLYFKHLPELPGFEYGMYLLYRKLIGHGIPPSELVKIGSQPYLVSLGIEGQNLADVIKETPDLLKQLDLQSLSDLIHMVMLTNPEDDQAANRILRPHPFRPNLYLPESPDNDHALMPTVARTNEDPQASKTLLQVKSILYCLDQMKNLVSQETKDLFTSLNPYKVLKSWLQKLKQVNQAYENLFPNEEARNLTSLGCVVCIPFKPQMITQLYDKMIRLQRILAPKEGKPAKALANQDSLKELENLLYKRYAVGFEKPLTVAERFELINGRFYKRDSATGYISTTSSSLLLKSLGIPIEESLIDAVRRGGYLTVDTAMEELEAIRAETDRELLGGDKAVEHLKLLKSENARALFLSRFDFKDLDLTQQQALLRLLKESDPRSLTFRNCQALTPHSLLNEIGVGNLTRLTVENNTTLDDAFMKELETRNAALKGLYLTNLPQLTRIEGTFPHLTTLSLKNCPALKSLNLTTPHLQKLTASQCPLLDEVKVLPSDSQELGNSTPRLRFLDLSNNASITDKTLDALLETQLRLKILKVQESPKISFPDVRSANHKYPIALLKALGPGIARLTPTIAEFLQQDKTPQQLEKLGNYSLYCKEIGDKGARALEGVLKINTILQQLNLGYNEIETEGARALGEGLKTNTILQHLDLRYNRLSNGGVVALGEGLRVNVSLKQLNLDFNYIEAMGAKALGKVLKVNTALKHLILRCNKLKAKGAKGLGNGLKINTSLRRLDMDSASIGAEGAKALGKALKVNRALQALDLHHNEIWDEGIIGLGEGIKGNSTVQKLDLSYNKIGDQGAGALGETLEVNTALQQLDLSHNNIGDEGGRALGKALKVNTALALQRLELSYNQIGDEGAKALGEGLKLTISLQDLHLCDNKIGAEGAINLGEGLKLNTSLQMLGLSYNKIGAEGGNALGEALEVNTTLQWLNLGSNQIGDEGARRLGKGLRANFSLQRLYLSGNKIEDEGAINLVEGLKLNTSLQQLDLSHNKIGVEGGRTLSEALKINTTLQNLNLTYNKLRDEGARALSEALKVNTTLQQLDLSSNKIKDEGVGALSEALKVNTTLQQLDLGGNKVGDEGARARSETDTLLRRNQKKASSPKAAFSTSSEEAFSALAFLRGTSEGISFTLSSFSPPSRDLLSSLSEERSFADIPFTCTFISPHSLDLLDLLGCERGSLVQQLLNLKDQRAFREALGPDIKEAFLKYLLPHEMHDAHFLELDQERVRGKKQGFEERLKAYTEDISTYRYYLRFVLGNTENALQHTLHGGSLRAMAKLQGLSYLIWQHGV
ncbi:MAG: hypothetical protein BGO67_00390, partial [Alphaproteobacteria bacterium 41-28]